MSRRRRNYKLFPLARADLEEIWLYTLKTWSPSQADSYHQKIVDAFEGLASGAREGRNADRVRHEYFRLPVGSHVMFYRKSAAEIAIVRILHQSMDFERHL